MKRKFVATIHEYLTEQKKLNYDELFIKLARLKYYQDGTTEEIKDIHNLEALLKSTPKPKKSEFIEDTRTEWGGVKLNEIVSAKDLPKLYDDMGVYADDSSNKFKGDYKLTYVKVNTKIDKYELANDYEDLEHFDRVNEYADIIRSGEELPPVIFTDFFHDGAHRMAAHIELGRKRILAFCKI